MKNLLLLFLPLLAKSQTITFHEGAGLNPRHIESLGPDSGWVELWVGPMAMDGQAFKIMLDGWDEIESIDVISFFGSYSSVKLKPMAARKKDWIGLSVTRAEQGDFIRYSYTVKRKKA